MRPPTLLIAALVVALEGAVALGLGVFAGVETLAGAAGDVTAAAAEAGFGILLGAGLLWVAYGGLFRMERWGRSPGVLAQIIAIPVGVTLFDSGKPVLGIPLVLIALIGIGTLLAPPTTKALYGEDASPQR
ncbi:MAG: hypothetical protein HOY71_12150 [Nonomuraea sp.]|nr:hypothetical protein [Nonomuraea sp.]